MLTKAPLIRNIIFLFYLIGSWVPLQSQVFLEYELPVDFEIRSGNADTPGENYQGKVRVTMECVNGDFSGEVNQNSPTLLFSGKRDRIRVTFSDLKLPPNDQINIKTFVLRISEIVVNDKMKVRGNFRNKKLAQDDNKSIKIEMDVLDEGRISMEFQFGIDMGAGLILSYNINEFTQKCRIIKETDRYAEIVTKKSQLADREDIARFIKLCEQYNGYFSSTSDTKTQDVQRWLLEVDNEYWNNTSLNNINSILDYLGILKSPSHEAEAIAELKKIHSKAWADAKSTATIKGYDQYLTRFEKLKAISNKARDARTEIRKLDDKAWENARSTNTIKAYDAYLNLFKGTKIVPFYKTKALTNKHKINSPDKNDDSAPSVEDIEGQLWDKASALNTVEGYQQYMAHCMSCIHEEEANRLIMLLTPITVDLKRDSIDKFHYWATINSIHLPKIDSIIPAIGVDTLGWTYDTLASTLELIIQDRKKHTFFVSDSLGRTHTFEVDVSIEPITAKLEQDGENLVFTIKGGIPPYYVQFSPAGKNSTLGLSGLYPLGDSSVNNQWKIPVTNLSSEILAGFYDVIIKDSRLIEPATYPNFELVRPRKLSLWVYLIVPFLLLTGFLVYRNIEIG